MLKGLLLYFARKICTLKGKQFKTCPVLLEPLEETLEETPDWKHQQGASRAFVVESNSTQYGQALTAPVASSFVRLSWFVGKPALLRI